MSAMVPMLIVQLAAATAMLCAMGPLHASRRSLHFCVSATILSLTRADAKALFRASHFVRIRPSSSCVLTVAIAACRLECIRSCCSSNAAVMAEAVDRKLASRKLEDSGERFSMSLTCCMSVVRFLTNANRSLLSDQGSDNAGSPLYVLLNWSRMQLMMTHPLPASHRRVDIASWRIVTKVNYARVNHGLSDTDQHHANLHAQSRVRGLLTGRDGHALSSWRRNMMSAPSMP